MIVIATNNGWDYLEDCLKSIDKIHEAVVVVDTGSSDEKFKEHAEQLCKHHKAKFLQCEPGECGYELGALKKAYAKFPGADNYVIIQDSLSMKANVIEAYNEALEFFDIVGWHFFSESGTGWDGEEQKKWLIENFGTEHYDVGIYGSVLAMKRETLEKIYPDIKDVMVDSKMKEMGMERAWSTIAKKNGISVGILESYKGPIQSQAYTYFVKAKHRSGRYRS